jgi:hypothetical protein
MFRNGLSHQVYGHLKFHISARQLIADYIEGNEDFFRDI